MGYLVQKAAVSGKVISFPSPTSLGNLIILVATWAEDAPVGEQLEFGTTAPLCNFVTDDGANTWRQARNPDTNSIIMAVVAANSCQTITTDPHYFTTSIDDGPANPAGLRLRAYEVSSIPGPSGHLPEGSTNVQENGCVGLGQTTPGDPQSPSVNPASTIAAASWSDMIGDNGFFIFVLAPNGGAGNDNFSGTVASVAAPAILDDPFGPSAVAYVDGQSADSNQTATFTWSNTAGWSIQSAAWEAFGAAPITGSIRIVKATVPGGAAQPFTFRPSWAGAFVLHDGQSNDSGALAPGTYSITEDAVANWSTVVTGGDPTNIVVNPGGSSTLIFTNTFVPPAKGRIIVHKVTNPVADPQGFTFRPSWGAPFVLGDGQSNDSGPLDAGTYAVTEDPVDGWTTETSQDPSTIVVEDGSNTDITFTNTKTPICIVQPPETGVMKFARGIGDLNNEMLALECSNEAVPGAWFELHEMVLYARPSAQSRKG